jgi:hypothetical protein
MTKRKETPDILAEILGGDEPPALETPPAPPSPRIAPTRPPGRSARSAASEPRAARKSAPPSPAPAAQELEYLLVSFQYHHGWRPRFHNGSELEDWLDGPPIHEHLRGLASQGWKLVAATSGERVYAAADNYQLYFKRPKA